MKNNPEHLTIGAFARAAGVNVETIRFYQRRGLLAEPAKPLGGIRRYGEAEVARVLFVKSAQRIGFTLDEIAQLLQLDDGTQCKEARAIAEHKLADVRKRLQDLQRIEAALAPQHGGIGAGLSGRAGHGAAIQRAPRHHQQAEREHDENRTQGFEPGQHGKPRAAHAEADEHKGRDAAERGAGCGQRAGPQGWFGVHRSSRMNAMDVR